MRAGFSDRLDATHSEQSQIISAAKAESKLMKPNEEPKGPGRPPFPEGQAAHSQIQLRVQKARKGAYVHAANKKGQTLAAWCFEHLDKASGYKPDA